MNKSSKVELSLEEEITQLAKSMGVNLVGFTDNERLEKAPPSGHLTNVLSNAQSGIGLAVALDKEAAYKFMSKEDYWAFNIDHQQSYHKITKAGRAIKELLEQHGHDVFLPMVNFQYKEDQPDPRNVATPMISHKYVCEAAGIGWAGWSGNLLTSEYGALVTLGCVVTSAKLEPSPVVVEDWCSNCRICTAVCPTHYMPKKEADEIQIAGHTSRYAKRRTVLRCNITCGGANCKRKDNSKWSTWSADYIEGLPNAHESDEAFQERVVEEIENRPDDVRLRAIYNTFGINTIPEEAIDHTIDQILLACSLCQLVCVPGMKERQEAYRIIIDSGHILEDDPRLQPPADMPVSTAFYDVLEANSEDSKPKT